jgi:hypothetical protein
MHVRCALIWGEESTLYTWGYIYNGTYVFTERSILLEINRAILLVCDSKIESSCMHVGATCRIGEGVHACCLARSHLKPRLRIRSKVALARTPPQIIIIMHAPLSSRPARTVRACSYRTDPPHARVCMPLPSRSALSLLPRCAHECWLATTTCAISCGGWPALSTPACSNAGSR